MTRAWLIFKNFLVHLFRGGEDRIAVGRRDEKRAIERQER
jgi:hypothetical protein